MKKKIAGIFADTPFQLTTALNIAKNHCYVDGCYLFLMKKLYRTDRLFTVETDHEYVKGIYYLHDYEEIGAFRHRMLRVKGLLTGHPSKNYPNFFCYFYKRPVCVPKLDVLIVNKYESIIAEEYKEVFKRDIPVYVIEDGYGDYTCQPTKIGDKAKRIYYWPELFTRNFHMAAIQAPFIDLKDAYLSNLFDSVFHISQQDICEVKKCKCLYLHQPYSGYDECIESKKKFFAFERKLIDYLNRVYGDSFYIKLHPRDNLNQFEGFKKLNSSVSMEALLNHLPDISDIVLISINSTALLTPKMCYDAEPKIIVLQNIWTEKKDEKIDEDKGDSNNPFSELKAKYEKKDRLFVPNDEEELFQNIDLFLDMSK